MTQPSVCIDARMARASGIGTYVQGLLTAIGELDDPGYRLTLLGDITALSKGPWAVLPASAPIYSLREQWEIPWAVQRTGASLLHAPHYNVPVCLASRSIVTVHDLIHLKFPQFLTSAAARAYARFYFRHVIPRARKILTVSENSRRDLMESTGLPSERIVVTYPAVSGNFQPIPQAQLKTALTQRRLPPEYLLYVGNLKESKNSDFLLKGYRLLKERRPDSLPLVLVGRNFIKGFERTIAQTPGVHWLGECEPAFLPFLYNGAALFIFPSLYEGFGLPPLEAMACGTPVACSDRGSLPEVVGQAALLFDPEKLEDMVAAIEKALDSSELRAELSRKGRHQASQFSWRDLAKKTLDVYRECSSRP